jgi:hypothetical protein
MSDYRDVINIDAYHKEKWRRVDSKMLSSQAVGDYACHALNRRLTHRLPPLCNPLEQLLPVGLATRDNVPRMNLKAEDQSAAPRVRVKERENLP